MRKGEDEVNNVDALEAPARDTELEEELDGGEAGKKIIRFFHQADPRLADKTNDAVILPAIDGALANPVTRPGRPILFLGAAKRIVDGDSAVVIFSRRELPVVRRSSHVDALVARILKDGAGRVADVRTLK